MMPATNANPDQIIAHVALLRAVDRLLTDADEVRERREELERLISKSVAGQALPEAQEATAQ
jgi:hypothetical protein